MLITCTVDGCDRPSRGTRFCPMHWARLKRHGDLDGLFPQGSPFERLMRRVVKQPDGCWIFTGATKNGYAAVGAGGKHGGSVYGHRIAYEAVKGPIPADTPRLHHLCEVRRCVNPDHLVPTTASAHALEHGLGQDVCPNCGWSDWYLRPDTGGRWCRECRRRKRRRR